MFPDKDNTDPVQPPMPSQPGSQPIEPEIKSSLKQYMFKWLFFLLFIIYIIIVYYHAPILNGLGKYLVIEYPMEKSDLIVSLAGNNIERGLETADAYREGLAPYIFMAREELPDGYYIIEEKGIEYPESIDLFVMLEKELGVPHSAVLLNDVQVDSTLAEAELVKKEVEDRDFKSLIIITSPIHTRRAWMTYNKVFKDRDVRILVRASKYSGFDPENWWKERKYVREVIIEYQKLLYYILKYRIL